MIVAEVALAFVLLVVSGLMMRSFMGLLNVDAGFDSTNLLTMRLPADVKQYPDPEQLNRYLDLNGSRVQIPTTAVEWPRAEGAKRCAGVSSFGFGGTNAHVVIEEAQPVP